jgi:translation initiation factor 2 subunit 2
MMEYEKLLKKAMEKLPKKTESKDRFKIPQVVCEITGQRSTVKNFSEILSILRRDGNHLAKYLGRELATACNIQGATLVFQGKVSKEMLQKKVEEYIKEFVYCKVCGEPDTKLIKEDRIYFLKCEACGARNSARSI